VECLIWEEHLGHGGGPCPHVVCDDLDEDVGRASEPGEEYGVQHRSRPCRTEGVLEMRGNE